MKILVTGGHGFVGGAISRSLRARGYEVFSPSRQELNLVERSKTLEYLSAHEFDLIIHCAARVGGIIGNVESGSDFFLENLEIDASLLRAAAKVKVKDLIYVSSSCTYPINVNRAYIEQDLLTGPLEVSSEAFALSKIVGVKTTRTLGLRENLNWRVLVFSNLFGPGDHFEDTRSHMLSALISKVEVAKREGFEHVEMWGDGSPVREFTYVNDVADWLADSISRVGNFPLVMNVGSGEARTIREFYEMVIQIIGVNLDIRENTAKPNGAPSKIMDSSKAKLYGWAAVTPLESAISLTVDWYRKELELRGV